MDYLAIDTETTGFDWWAEDYAFEATTSDFGSDAHYFLKNRDELDRLEARMNKADVWIFHNAAFDIHFLNKAGFDLDWLLEEKTIHDTSLLARIVVPSEEAKYSYKLKTLSTLLLGDGADDEEKTLKKIMKGLGLIQREDQQSMPPGAYLTVYESGAQGADALINYARKDTRLTYDLYHTLVERMNDNDRQAFDLETMVMPHIIRMEHYGIGVDQSKAIELQQEYTKRQADAHTRLSAHTNRDDFNPDSNDQVAEVLIAAGVPLTALTESGQIRVDKWALEKFAGHPAVDALLDLRTASKFLSTYIEPMAQVTRIHPSIWQIGARTHRMSCSRPNMQNIPARTGPEVRELLVPREDHAFVVCDYGQIEPRILAFYMNDPEFIALVNEGKLYEVMGESIYGTADQTTWPVTRQALKNGTLALTYGAGGPKLASTIGGGMTADEGRAWAKQIRGFLGPKYRELTDRVKFAVKTRGYVKTMFGRRLYVPKDRDYTGLNYLIQGSAAEIMKLGLVAAAEATEGIAWPVLPVHDELIVECKAEDAEGVRDLVREAMTGVVPENEKLTLVVSDAICYQSWGEAK